MKRNLVTFLLLVAGFFALYALTAQRGFGWGDSGEFQHRILDIPLAQGLVCGCDSFATAHPLHMLFGKAVAWTPFGVTLVSSFWGAMAVGGLFLCTRKWRLAVLFGLAHAFWWLSCVAEVYTMTTALLAFEVALLMRFVKGGRWVDLAAMMFVNGLNLCVHNVALLSLPVYGIMLLTHGRRCLREIPFAAVAWAAGAGIWIFGFFSRGPADVLFGGYSGAALGFWPENWKITGFNYALAFLSVVVPLLIFRWRDRASRNFVGLTWPVISLATIHLLFWIRYFNVSQFTFFLPTIFFMYLLLSGVEIRRTRFQSLVAMQLLLPVLAYLVLSQFAVPKWYTYHPHRNEAAYFALPWKFHDNSADICAAEVGGVWNGYPNCRRESDE